MLPFAFCLPISDFFFALFRRRGKREIIFVCSSFLYLKIDMAHYILKKGKKNYKYFDDVGSSQGNVNVCTCKWLANWL
jgi:hypothetical protein